MKPTAIIALLALALLLAGCARQTALGSDFAAPPAEQADSIDIPPDEAPAEINVDINDEELSQLDM